MSVLFAPGFKASRDKGFIMQQAIDQLLEQPGIWRATDQGGTRDHASERHIPTGFSALDSVLPGGGLPPAALTEILHGRHGMGELQLLMPALARLSRGGRWIAMVAPPFLPYAPALAAQGLDLSRVLTVHPGEASQSLWAVEQALRSGTCAAVLLWPRQCDERSLRRLQLAAEAGDSLGLLFREQTAAQQRSPAALRLMLEDSSRERLNVRILKCRGTPAGSISLDHWAGSPVRQQQALPLEP